MCLLISQPAGVTFSRREIEDFVSYNPDGFGLAYGDGRTLHLVRMVGNVSEIWDTYRTLAAGKRCVLHFRMTTHGATDANNAHPYPVTDDIVIAHNGVLSCGNPVDPCRSDTWHFIEYFLAPIARTNPDLLFTAEWADMCGRLIGASNKLAIVHRDGRIALVNQAAGVTHKRAWLSNTYAWSAPNKYGSAGGWLMGSYGKPSRKPAKPAVPVRIADVKTEDEAAEWDAYVMSDIWDTAAEAHRKNQADGLLWWVHNNPHDAAALLSAVSGCAESEASEWLEETGGDAITYLMEYFDTEGEGYQDETPLNQDTPDYTNAYASAYAYH